MFNAYEFTFAGESSYMYDLMIYDFGSTTQEDVKFGNRASIIETRTVNRIQPIHFGVNYHEKPLEFKLVFGSHHALDRYDIERISMWLTGHHDYQWLSIDQRDMSRVQFRCLITSLTPITDGWLPYAFEAEVTCDCPYAYGFPFEYQYAIEDNTPILFRNESTVREYIKPTLHFQPDSNVREVKIINNSDNGRVFSITGLPASSLNIEVDNSNGIITEHTFKYNLYSGFNLNFFRLVPGDNELVVSGNGLISITGRFLYNVAG